MLKSFSFFGLFEVYFFPIFLILAAFFGTFVFYRHLHKRASYKEFEVFDAFLLSLLFGFITGRLTFIGLNWANFNWDFYRWLNFLAYPGIAVFIAIFTCSFFLWLFLRHHKITDLEILDYWSRATCLGLVFYHLGLFLDGTGAGHITDSIFGVTFSDLTVKLHPTQLYAAIFYFLLFFALASLEKNYRTFNWYRGHRSQAKTGFIFITFLAAYALCSLFLLLFQPPSFAFQNFSLDWIFYLLLLLLAFILLLKNILPAHKK